MRECRLAPTANRSVVGIMNEFTSLADTYRRNDPTSACPDWPDAWRRRHAVRSMAATSAQIARSKPYCIQPDRA
jgi:hypothetical protein